MSKKMNKIFKFINFERITFLVLLGQVLFLLVYNLVFMQNVIDTDSSAIMSLAREIGRQGTLFPKDYCYQTTLDLHGMTILSAVLYSFIGNIRIAQGLANDVIILIFVYLLYCVFRRLELSATKKNLIVILYFIPWTTGQVGYIRMTFLAGAFYIHRLILPVLMIGIILDQEKKIARKRYLIRFIYLILVCFINCLSSGPYTLMCSIAPIFTYELIRCFIIDDYSWFKTKRFITEISAVVASLLGLVASKYVGFEGRVAQMTMIDSSRLLNNIGSCMVGIFGFFGGTTDTRGVSFGSAVSLSVIIGFCFTVLFLISLILCMYYMIRNKEDSILNGYAFMLLFVNFAVYSLLDTRYSNEVFETRYHIISLGLTFFAAAWGLEKITESIKERQGLLLNLFVFLIVLASLFIGDAKLFFYNKRYNIDEMKQINTFLEDNNISTTIVYGIDDEDIKMGRTLRAYSEINTYIPVFENMKTTGGSLFGGSEIGWDNAEHNGKIAFITKEDYLNHLPGYVRKQLQYEKTFDSYNLYYCEKSCFDFEGGLNDRENLIIDFPYSPGYEVFNGEVNDDGELISSGDSGQLLKSQYQGVEGEWEYDVMVNMSRGAANIQLYTDDSLVSSATIEPGNNGVTLDGIKLNGHEIVTFVISEVEGTEINIERIEMRRIR